MTKMTIVALDDNCDDNVDVADDDDDDGDVVDDDGDDNGNVNIEDMKEKKLVTCMTLTTGVWHGAIGGRCCSGTSFPLPTLPSSS